MSQSENDRVAQEITGMKCDAEKDGIPCGCDYSRIKSALDAKDAEIAKLTSEIEDFEADIKCLKTLVVPKKEYDDMKAERDSLAIEVGVLRKALEYFKGHGLTEESRKVVEDALATPKSPAVLEVEGKLAAGRKCFDAVKYFQNHGLTEESRRVVDEALASAKAAVIVN